MLADGFFPGELAVIQIGIKSVLAEQLFVAAFFNNISVFHHKNHVGIFNGRKTVGDNKARTVGHQFVHRFLNIHFRPGVDTACRFI